MNLTPYACSVHTHSAMCDGRDTLEAMAQAAWMAGVKYFGASGHSHTPVPEDQEGVLPGDMSDYRGEVLRLREVYAGRMEVLLGIELDSFADVTPEGFDYWIGSVHRLRGPDGRDWAVDWSAERLLQCLHEAFGGDGDALAKAYYEEVGQMARRGPTILGHVDLITKYMETSGFPDETSPRYRAAALAALHQADPRATLLEVNTGAMSRGYRHTPYPARFLLEEWRAMGGRIILTADAHSASAVTFGYREAIDAAEAAGFTTSTILTRNGPLSCAFR